MKLRPKKVTTAAVFVAVATGLISGCSASTNSQEPAQLLCETSHATTVYDSENIKAIEIPTERSALTGKSTIFIISNDEQIRIQTLIRESNRFRVSDKNQAVIAKDAEGTVLSASPQLKVGLNLITVIEIPYHVLESIEITQTVKPNNSQIGAVAFYPVKETNIGYDHPLNALEEMLAPGTNLPPEVNNYLLSNLSSGGILIPDISKDFINFSKVKTVSSICD